MFTVSPNAIVRKIDEKILIINTTTGTASLLDDVATDYFEAIKQATCIEDVYEYFLLNYDVDISQVVTDVETFLFQMRELGIYV